MNLTGFLAAVANNLLDKYEGLTEQSRRMAQSLQPSQTTQPVAQEEPKAVSQPVDTYRPSEPTAKPSSESEKQDQPTGSEPPEPEVGTNPDGTYYYRRAAKLEYQLDLRFDLAAILRTAQQVANGDTESIEQVAAAGFGLHAGFDLHGTQVVETNMTEGEGDSVTRQRLAAKSRRIGALAYRDRNFAMRSFYNEAAKIRSSLDESVQGDHRRTVNRFALRYRMDNQFSFGFAQRFNVQTKQIADRMPEAVSGYVNSAGELASTAGNDLMASFFDAVDGYLAESETALIDKVTQFFDLAAEQLGFSGAATDAMRDQLVGTIESFFDRVQSAVDGMEGNFVTAPSIPELPETTPVPEAAEDTHQIAVA